jgi:hypothetical protein
MLFQVISGPIPPMITGLLEQFMNLNWLIFYLIMVFIIDVVRWLWGDHKTLEICLILIIIIILFYHDLPHTEFNSANFEDFSSTYFKLVVSIRGHVVPNDNPQLFIIILFQIFVIHKHRMMILWG